VKIIKRDDLNNWLLSFEECYTVYAPVALDKNNRTLALINEKTDLSPGGQLPLGPIRLFFPECEKLLKYKNGQSSGITKTFSKPLLIFGCSAADVKAIKFSDRFFNTDFVDPNYESRRQNAVTIVYSGYVNNGSSKNSANNSNSSNTEFEALAFSDYDIQVVSLENNECLVKAGSDPGKELIEKFNSKLTSATPDTYNLWNELEVKTREIPKEADIKKAAKLLAHDKVEDEFWDEIGKRCISCGGCTYVCPTCTCFDVYDRGSKNEGVRLRCRDSCLLGGFTREASRHNPRGSDGKRTKRRIEHKLLYDPMRWDGETGCIECGRCDNACPTGIGMYNVVKEMLKKYD